MQREILIKSRSVRSYHGLGVMGKPVYASAERLRSAIRSRLGDPHARLFAIPRLSDDGGSMDWYVEGEGPVVSWIEATSGQRQRIVERVEELLAGLKELANAPVADADGGGEELRQLVRQALFVPERMENVFLVGDQPVVTFWGYVTHDMKGDNDILFHLREEYTGHGEQAAGAPVHEGLGVPSVVSGKSASGLRKVLPQVMAILVPLFVVAGASAFFLMDRMGPESGEMKLPPGARDAPARPVKPALESPPVAREGESVVVLPDAPEEQQPLPAAMPDIAAEAQRLYETGMARLRDGDFIEAMDHLRRAADEGHVEAMAAYANLRDPVVARNMNRPMGIADAGEALAYYRKAEAAGFDRAASRRERLEEYMKSGSGPAGGGHRNEAW